MSGTGNRQAPPGYSGLQIALHWSIALLIVVQLLWHDDMEDAFVARGKGDAAQLWGAWGHAGLGLGILALTVLRLVIRWTRGAPEPSKPAPPLFVWAGWAAHFVLYLFLVAMPVSGALAWFWGIDLAGEVHEALRFVFLPLILAHAMGAVVEHAILGNDTLKRMLNPEIARPD